MVKREIQSHIEKKLFKGKAIVLTGARQVGKTTLVKMIAKSFIDKVLYLNCDEPDIRLQLSNATSTQLKRIVGNKKLIIIDEAQRVINIGLTIKLFVDELPENQVIATGSSAIDIANEINEPLTGRKYEFHLYPFSWKELVDEFGYLETNRLLQEKIIYGMYPEVILKHEEKQDLLKSLTQSYLFKDILSFKDLRKPELLEKLVKALAMQIGNQVSYHELSNMLDVDNETIAKYVEILEKAFIVFRLSPFSRNLRSEITKMRKIYFFDTGIRNAIINNFTSPDLRQDIGALWENFVICERLKHNYNLGADFNPFFWRTQQQQEIDYLEVVGSNLSAYEFTWNPKTKKKIPKTFITAYPESSTAIINRESFHTFLGIP